MKRIAKKIAEIAVNRMSKEEKTVFARSLLSEEFDPQVLLERAMDLGAWNSKMHDAFNPTALAYDPEIDYSKTTLTSREYEFLDKEIRYMVGIVSILLTEDEIENFVY